MPRQPYILALLVVLVSVQACKHDLYMPLAPKSFFYPSDTSRQTGEYVLINATLWDGITDDVQDSMSVKIAYGKITQVGKQIPTQGYEVIDLKGNFLMPGIIDTHVHLGMVPASIQRNDAPTTLRDLRRQHLRSYVACGITTVLDAGIPEVYGHEIQTWLSQGYPGPDYFFLSPMLTPNGYISDFFPEHCVSNSEQVDRNFTRITQAGAFGIKCTIEPGPGKWPIYSNEVAESIKQGADRHNLKLFVHAGSEKDQQAAIDLLDVYAFMHPAVKGVVSEAHLDTLAKRNIPIVTTSALSVAFLTEYNQDWLEDSLTSLVVPPIEIASAKDERTIDIMKERMLKQYAPSWVPAKISKYAFSENRFTEKAKEINSIIKRHYANKNRLIMGSDAGTWPVIAYMFHGISTIREIENLNHAGIPAIEVLRMSTIRAAEFLGLQNECGSIEIGKKANLLILTENPLEDIRNIRSISYVVKNGELRSTYGWMNL